MVVLPRELECVDPGGRFVAAARAFLARRGATLAPGARGVRTLTSLLVEHACEDDGSGDDAFVEGAGACLGLLLAHAFRGETRAREGQHRVLVGELGTIDPFELVARALEADDPREAFARALEAAEAEARGEGPIASALRTFAAALDELGVPHRIADRFELAVTLDDGTEIDLSRVAEAREAGPAIARHLARMLLPQEDARASFAETKERILPRVVGDAFLTRLGASAAALATTRVAEGLHLGLIAHFGDRARFLRRDELVVAGERFEDVAALAFSRLLRRSQDLAFRREGETFVLASRDGLDAARILLPGLARTLAGMLGAVPYVAAPHRDLLLASADPEALAKEAEDAYRRAPHGVSPRVYRFDGERLSPRPFSP